jgi:two-component system response regulator FixJ
MSGNMTRDGLHQPEPLVVDVRSLEGTSGPAVHVIGTDEEVLRDIASLLRSAHIPVVLYQSGVTFLLVVFAWPNPAIGCVLTEWRMVDPAGIGLLRQLRERHFRRRVIVMTSHADVSMAVRAVKEGADDVIEMPFAKDELLAKIKTALETPDAPVPTSKEMPTGRVEFQAESADAVERIAALSKRELEVLQLLMAGKSNKAIAVELGRSPRTVEVHRARLMARLGVHSLAEAVRLALRADVVIEQFQRVHP